MSSCVDCGESNPIVLDFDHVHGDKSHNISDMVNGSYAISSIKDEIRKCEIRCSNCHRKKHTNEEINNAKYLLKLIPCRKSNWLHVGSSPTSRTFLYLLYESQ